MGGQRRNRHPPVGQDKPEAFRVVVNDTYIQHMLRNAALVIRNGSDVPEFLLFCASYARVEGTEAGEGVDDLSAWRKELL